MPFPRLGGGKLQAKAVSAAMLSASMAILIWWAETDDPRTPSEVLDDGFSDFDKHFLASRKSNHTCVKVSL